MFGASQRPKSTTTSAPESPRRWVYSRGVLVRIRYTAATGEKLVNVTFGPNNIRRRTAGTEEVHDVEIRNGRISSTPFSLDENGFVVVEHRTAVRDFFDKAELERVYYPEVSELIRSVSGAARVVAFDHTLRSGDEASPLFGYTPFLLLQPGK